MSIGATFFVFFANINNFDITPLHSSMHNKTIDLSSCQCLLKKKKKVTDKDDLVFRGPGDHLREGGRDGRMDAGLCLLSQRHAR
jgi:hypothetical protein